MRNTSIKYLFLFIISAAAIIVLITFPAIKQNDHYHQFADNREVNAIPNCYNVISNFPFIVFGIFGLALSFKGRVGFSLQYGSFFIGIILTGLGSSYYHVNPNLNTLVWDRLPMTITFMAFFSIIISDFIHLELGKKLLFHLIFIGLLSVCYWYYTETLNKGDLRFYILVQFLPILIIPVIILLFPNNNKSQFYYWLIILVYLIAKFFETCDKEILIRSQFISGHTIKHLFASFAAFILILKIKRGHKLMGEIRL